MNCVNKDFAKVIEGFSVLSAAEEKALAVKIQAGDKKALDKLVNSNLRFVVKIAHEYERCNLELDDLVSEGTTGLIAAAKKINPNYNVRFISYAVYYIRDAIQKAIRLTSTGFKFSAGNYKEMANLKFECLDAVRDKDSGYTLFDSLEDTVNLNPEDACIKNHFLNKINDYLNLLSFKERYIIERRFGLNGEEVMSLSKIGSKLNISKEGVRYIERKMLNEMKDLLAV